MWRRLKAVASMATACLAATAAAAQTKPEVGSFRISGVSFEMPAPPGYCLPKGKDVDVAQLLAAGDTQNVTHLTLVRCSADSPNDYILVKTPTGALLADVGREDALKALAAAFDEPALKDKFSSGKILAEAGEAISGTLHRKVDITGEVKPAGRDQACAYMGGTTDVKAPETSYRVSVGGCITAVGRRIVSLFVYGPDKGASGVTALLGRARQLMETIRVVPAG
jgi:hypothetical protein